MAARTVKAHRSKRMMPTVIACAAPYGEGGLGRHLMQVVEEARVDGSLERYFATRPRPDDEAGERINMRVPGALCLYSPARFSPSWQTSLSSVWFDRAVAAKLPKSERYHGFALMAARSLRRARVLGYTTLTLESTSSHVRNVMRQQERATREWGIEGGWLNEHQVRQTIDEIEQADSIYVTSNYSRETFLLEGVPEWKLRQRELVVAPRFRPDDGTPSHDRFRVIYVGGLTVVKGIPVLLEAFSRLVDRDAELVLVGGWSTRAMRLYLQRWLERDGRIRIMPGDPLAALQGATIYVHPSYQDGFGFAPMEALCCGIPAIVSADTGMKDHVTEGRNGYIVPTGDWRAILEKLEYVHDHPLSAEQAQIA